MQSGRSATSATTGGLQPDVHSAQSRSRVGGRPGSRSDVKRRQWTLNLSFRSGLSGPALFPEGRSAALVEGRDQSQTVWHP